MPKECLLEEPCHLVELLLNTFPRVLGMSARCAAITFPPQSNTCVRADRIRTKYSLLFFAQIFYSQVIGGHDCLPCELQREILLVGG
jgi:hypothetical protein